MKRIVSIDQVVEYDHMPFTRTEVRNNPDILRSFLFTPYDPSLTDDDHCLVLDYDGFIEWFPEWNQMYADEADEEWYKDSEGAEYLIEHIDCTVGVVKAVRE